MSTQKKWKLVLIRDGEGSIGGQLRRQGRCGFHRGTSQRALAVWLGVRWTQQRARALGSCFLGTSLPITHMQPMLYFVVSYSQNLFHFLCQRRASPVFALVFLTLSCIEVATDLSQGPSHFYWTAEWLVYFVEFCWNEECNPSFCEL